MPRPKKPPPEKVVRRPKSERKGLSPELESLARGDTDRLFRPHRVDPERVRDPRDGFAMKGVANRDARAVYDARLAKLHALVSAQPEEQMKSNLALGDELCDWLRLELWRAKRVTSFRSFAEDVLGQSEESLRELATKAAARAAVTLEPVGSERTVALWLRLEAGLLEADPSAFVRFTHEGRFEMCVAVDPAAAAVAAASVRVSPMARGKRPGRPRPGGDGEDERPSRDRGGSGDRRERSGGGERRERSGGGERRDRSGGDRRERSGGGERSGERRDRSGGDRPPRKHRSEGRSDDADGSQRAKRASFGERHTRKKGPRS